MEILLLAAVAGGTAFATWIADRRRCRSRNRRGECGACGRPWPETLTDDAYLIHGRLICAECAGEARRRMPWYFGALAVSAAGAAALTVASEGWLAMVLLPLGATAVMTAGTLHLMKLANRIAQRRIAFGEFPDYHKVRETLAGGSADVVSPSESR